MVKELQWRHNEPGGVSKHWHLDCLLNLLLRRRSKKTKVRVTGLCEENPRVTSEFPAQRASNTEMFPFDDVIMNVFSTTSVALVFYPLPRPITHRHPPPPPHSHPSEHRRINTDAVPIKCLIFVAFSTEIRTGLCYIILNILIHFWDFVNQNMPKLGGRYNIGRWRFSSSCHTISCFIIPAQ